MYMCVYKILYIKIKQDIYDNLLRGLINKLMSLERGFRIIQWFLSLDLSSQSSMDFFVVFNFIFIVDTITNVPISPHFALNIIFQLQFTFNIISYWFQAHSIVGTQSHTSQCSPRRFQCPPGPVHSCYSVINYIPYALLYISVTLVYPPICTL